MEIIYKQIPMFEPTKWLGFVTGYRVSRESEKWEAEAHAFNTLISKLAKKDKKKAKKINWQLMADCMAESYRNRSQAIAMFRQNANPRVVDMMETFGGYFL